MTSMELISLICVRRDKFNQTLSLGLCTHKLIWANIQMMHNHIDRVPFENHISSWHHNVCKYMNLELLIRNCTQVARTELLKQELNCWSRNWLPVIRLLLNQSNVSQMFYLNPLTVLKSKEIDTLINIIPFILWIADRQLCTQI